MLAAAPFISMESWKKNLYLIWFAQILSLTGFEFMLPFLPFYIQELGVTEPALLRFWVGLLSSIPGLLLALVAPLWGVLADRYGKRLMLLRSMLAGAVVVFAMSFAGNITVVLILRISQSILCGTVAAAATLVAAGTPKDRLSYALGFLSSSTFIGWSLGPFFGGLSAELAGYRASFRIGGAILFAGFLIVLLLIKEPEPQSEEQADSPPATPTRGAGSRVARAVLSPVTALLAVLLVLRVARLLPSSFISIYIQELRGTIEGSSAIMGIVSAFAGGMTAVSAIVAGRLADRYDKAMIVLVCIAAAAVLSLPIFFAGGLVPFLVFYVLTVFAVGGVEPILQATLAQRTDPRKRGLAFGIQTLVGSMALFLSPLAASAISIGIGTVYIFLFFSIFLALSFAFTAAFRRCLSAPAAALARGNERFSVSRPVRSGQS